MQKKEIFSMNISTIITVLFAGIFISLALLVYIRNRQGDQRMIQTANNMLLPLLTIITITLGSIFSFHTGNQPTLFAIILVIIAFLIEHLVGCLY